VCVCVCVCVCVSVYAQQLYCKVELKVEDGSQLAKLFNHKKYELDILIICI